MSSSNFRELLLMSLNYIYETLCLLNCMFAVKYGRFLSVYMYYNYTISNLLSVGLCSSVPENFHLGADLVNNTGVHKFIPKWVI